MDNAQNSAAMADLDSLLDATLDDLADVPEFKPFPAGAHRCTINWAFKEISKQMCPEIKLTAIETIELSNPEDTPVKAGDTAAQAFLLKNKEGKKNEISEGQLKNLLKPLQEHLGTASNRETIEKSNGLEVVAVTKLRTDNSDKDNVKHYLQVVNISVI